MSTVFHYGIPYMGSKDKIAQSLIRELPSGRRFCDLFGGGFAMSHAAFLSDKWDEVLYNEFNPLIFNLIKDALGSTTAIKRALFYKRPRPRKSARERAHGRQGSL